MPEDSESEYDQFIWKAASENLAAFDRAVVTLSASSLALTVTFIGNLVDDGGNAKWRAAALLGWIALTLAIVTSVASHLVSDRAFEAAERDDNHAIDRWNGRTQRMNVASALLLAAGLFGLALFAYQNL